MVVTKKKNIVKSKSAPAKKTVAKKVAKKTVAKKTVAKTAVESTTPAVETTPKPAVETTPEPAVEPTPSVESTTETSSTTEQTVSDTQESTEDSQEKAFEGLCSMVIDLQQQLRALSITIKTVQRNYKKEVKDLRKQCSKGRRKKQTDPSKKRAPSGFAKPTYLSAELCQFLDVPFLTQMARTDVTKLITKYVADHKLQNEKNKKQIIPDDKLKSLLKCNDDDEITYFNLQTYMKVHYSKEKPTQIVESISA